MLARGLVAALWLSCAGLCACAQAAPSAAPAAAPSIGGATGPRLVLTGMSPALSLQHAGLAPAPHHAAITLGSVHNPQRIAFSLRVTLEPAAAGADGRVEIAFVAPYPADRPGTFQATLTPAASRALASAGKLVLSLEPVSAALPADLRVELTAPRWQ